MKVTYWLAPCLNDSTVYSIRAKTKKAVVEKLQDRDASSYGPVEKVTIEYDDAFDLVNQMLSESSYGSL